jgi:hypothetical protein
MSSAGGNVPGGRIRAVVAAAVLLGAAAAHAQPASPLRLAVSRPVLDGMMLGGIRVGAPEAQVTGVLGPPQADAASPLGDRVLRFEAVAGLHLEVHVAGGAVRAVGMRADAGAAPALGPRTSRGVRLGSPTDEVVARYGAPTGDRLWYAAAGVAFNLEAAADDVQSILVFPPGTPPP